MSASDERQGGATKHRHTPLEDPGMPMRTQRSQGATGRFTDPSGRKQEEEQVYHNHPRRRSRSIHSPPMFRMVLLGSSVSENSQVGNFILGRAAFDSEAPPDVVERVGGRLKDRHVIIINSPQLLQKNISDHQNTQTVRECLSLCHPGVHAFLLIIPDSPINNQDRAEIEEIQRIFSSRINKHLMILMKQNSDNQTEELNEETQSVIQSLGGRHHFIDLNTQVSELMEKLEQMLEENRQEVFSTETLMEGLLKKTQSLDTPLFFQGSTEREDDLRIVLLGKTGVGKSATGNTILGRKVFKAVMSHESVTKVCQKETAEVSGRHITVIDTPGLFDTELSNEEIKREISDCISMILPGPHVFLLVITVGRFTQEEQTAVKIIQKTFGENSLKYTIVLFTRGEDLNDETIEQWLGKPGSTLKNLIEACGNRYHVFNNKETGAQTQVTDLLQKIDNMVKENGDSYYSCKMFREMERAIQEQQKNMLMEKVRETEEKMKKLEEEKEKMKLKVEKEQQNYEKERKRREDEFTEKEQQYKRKMEQVRDEMKREQEEWEKQKEEEKMKREEVFNEKEQYKTLIQEKDKKYREMKEEIKKERAEWEKQKLEKIHIKKEDEKSEREEQFCEEIQRLKSEMEGIIREKERIERERREQHEELKRRRVEWRKVQDQVKEKTICSETDPSLQRENKDIEPAEVKADDKQKNIFDRLHRGGRQHSKLKAADVLWITSHSLQYHESCAEKELIQTFLQKLLMMNYRARYIKTKQDHTELRETYPSEEESDIFKEMSFSLHNTSHSDLIHPMDVQMAMFHCADVFLKQLMVTKLSQCQYALPLLVPDPFTRQIEFPLWTFREIHKSWKMKNSNNKFISQTQPIYRAQTPMVFFFRFDSVSSSKSQLMNGLINDRHDTFFHRHCPGSSRTRELMDGVVEITWFCPSGTDNDKFSECVAFCNLHGDAGDHEKQMQILTDMSSVNVVLLPQLDRYSTHAAKIQKLYKNKKPLICLFSKDDSTIIKTRKGKYKIGLKDRNQSDVSEELRRAINDCLSESSHTFRLEEVSKHSEIRVDEEDDEDCRRGKEAAQQMMSLLEKKDLTEIKGTFLPHQGKLWHQWSQENKELHRPPGEKIKLDNRKKRTEMKKMRQQQHKTDISEFMKLFIKQIESQTATKMFFLKLLRIFLDEYISADLSALHHKYDEKRSTVLKLMKKHHKSEQLGAEQTELEKISEDLQASSFGLEHIMREIGQIYESCSSVQENKKDLRFNYSDLPSLAAEMMIYGFPLELMDGDAAHVPVIWISAVLDELIQKLGDQRVFVLSVLGLQSSGKSTMLNAMFGLQFAVGAGRGTRGAFMQLVRVSCEMKTELKFDCILVVDTEGLHALELSGRSKHHDNELATFVVGLGNLTLINIFGENPAEMQDILQTVVQAFMRMKKKVRLNPSCVFVHQNVSDVTAGEKNEEERRRLQETLDEMTKLAAKEEECDAECFSDVIRFDVQTDVKYIAQLWEGSPPMAPPNPNYCESIQELKRTIMSHASESHGMLLNNLKDHIKDLWEALLNENIV